MVVSVCMIVLIDVGTRLTVSGDIVLMKMKESQQKQHEDQSAHNEIHGAVDRLTQLKTVGNEMKSGNAEHEACDQAHH